MEENKDMMKDADLKSEVTLDLLARETLSDDQEDKGIDLTITASNRAAFSNNNNSFNSQKYSRKSNNSDAVNGLVFLLSGVYAKLLIIIGLCFPMAEVISHRIPIGWYEGFYLYLYLVSIVFLIFMCSCGRGRVTIIFSIYLIPSWALNFYASIIT